MTRFRILRQAQNFLDRGAPRRAAALYGRALAKSAGDRGAWLWRGTALAELGAFSDARRYVETAIGLEKEPGVGAVFLARVLFDGGQTGEARAVLQEYMTREDNANARVLLAACRVRLGEAAGARELLSGGLPFTPWLLARLLLAIEETAPHVADPPVPMETAASGRAAWLPSRFLRRGMLALRSGKWMEAVRAFSQAKRAMPEDARVRAGLGISYYYLNHFREAEQQLLPVLGKLQEPFLSEATATLGKIALELGRTSEAVLRLRKAIAAGASSPDNLYALGLAFLRGGKTRLARAAFQRCVYPEFVLERLQDLR